MKLNPNSIDFCWGWWENNKRPSDAEPDTDGSTEVAWEISTERSGWRNVHHGTIFSVKPIWFVYGK